MRFFVEDNGGKSSVLLPDFTDPNNPTHWPFNWTSIDPEYWCQWKSHTVTEAAGATTPNNAWEWPDPADCVGAACALTCVAHDACRKVEFDTSTSVFTPGSAVGSYAFIYTLELQNGTTIDFPFDIIVTSCDGTEVASWTGVPVLPDLIFAR